MLRRGCSFSVVCYFFHFVFERLRVHDRFVEYITCVIASLRCSFLLFVFCIVFPAGA